MLPARTIEDLPNSNLWFGKSCGIARQQVEAAQPPGCSARSGVKAPPTALQTASRNPVSLDSLHLIHGVNTFYAAKDLYALPNATIPSISESPHPHSVTPGDTERPVRLQFMAGRVGLYSDVIYTLKRPDSSRPQAARSRVAAREAV